ncbi:secretory carrier-associated membrane protein 1-like isoform X3 [Phyllopteryx taeniolatus]|uniref:secretory carrier-associated membrane protein 1-like isoform X3 n=1 Tax=Phyllopteryx taeniolatus TaxID=161469 RepID=UPI002AD4BBDE|nr:secretory carrier-associated membrane protein 1-like isoform X3 [Phyllopteryx taeniolatus]
MSEHDSNPFTEPELSNPFQDPSVTHARQTTTTTAATMAEYNPFTDSKPTAMASKPPTQPAIMKPTEEPPVYSQPRVQESTGGAGELLRRQEELERKAAELDRREREMQSLSASGGRRNNWPPLPEKFPVGPCFYHDVTVDIPVEYQKTVKIMYYLWMFHTGTLLANLLGSLAWFCVDPSRGVDFGLAILWFLLFTPCSFVCWYRPVYGAFNGWISALTCLNANVAVGVLTILVAALFTALVVMSLVMFKKVHAMYRTTGASFQKAQQEMAAGVMSNKTVQAAAATAGSKAAQGAFKESI